MKTFLLQALAPGGEVLTLGQLRLPDDTSLAEATPLLMNEHWEPRLDTVGCNALVRCTKDAAVTEDFDGEMRPQARAFLDAFYVAAQVVNNRPGQIGALRRAFDLQSAVITNPDELAALEWFALVKLNILH